jgi:hypothetical protein
MSLRPLIAAIALEEDALPAPEAVLQWLGRHWPELPAVLQPQERPGVMTLEVDRSAVGLALVSKPLAWEELAGPCAAAWYWPQAAAAFRRHAAHLVAAVLSGGRDRLRGALGLTAVVAAAAGAAEALGIYWGPGRLVHAPAAFFEESLHLGRENLPLNLWIDFRLLENDDQTHSLFTTGLAAFGHREVEIWDSRQPPQFLRDCAYNVAHHLLEKGAALKAGETIGISDDERIAITVEPSRWDSALRVTRLDV